jgi:hypothetical protein
VNDTEKMVSVTAIGQDLMSHAKSFDMDGNKRGLVVELFPAIFAASERMSARGISRFLKEKHGVKLSAVTVTKALNDPQKSWNLFFDTIEQYVKTYENWNKPERREDFLFDDKGFKPIQFPGREIVRKQLLKFEFARAIDVLREKWFAIDLETRMKARPYLAERLLTKQTKTK